MESPHHAEDLQGFQNPERRLAAFLCSVLLGECSPACHFNIICALFPTVFMLSCSFPRRPNFGEVAVMGLHSGGLAHFNCHLGYELEGPQSLTCLNASKPHWSAPEPICSGMGDGRAVVARGGQATP